MKVYYNSSIWGQAQGLAGRPQKINWEFESQGLRRIIPIIYHFSQGIVFDLITIINEREFQSFYEKYKDIEEDPRPMEEKLMEQEHPYQEIGIRDIWINGARVETGYSSSSLLFTPWNREEGMDSKGTTIRQAYSPILENTSTFNCTRYKIPYPSGRSKNDKLLASLHLARIEEIRLATYPKTRFYPLNREFEMGLGDNIRKTNFIHPRTGINHKLYFQNPQAFELEGLYFLHALYEIEPELAKGSKLEFDSSIQYKSIDTNGAGSSSAATIGIIRGADGATSIFVGKGDQVTEQGQNKLALYPALSRPSLEKQDRFRFLLEGINIEVDKGREYFWRKE